MRPAIRQLAATRSAGDLAGGQIQRALPAAPATPVGKPRRDGAAARVGALKVVLLVSSRTAEMLRWLNVFSEYATARGYRIVVVTSDPLAAMAELVAGRAQRILTGSDHELRPLVETITGQADGTPASQRRPRRLR